MLNFSAWLTRNIDRGEASVLFDGFDDPTVQYDGREFELTFADPLSGALPSKHTFTLHREQIRRNSSVTGYVITMTNVSTYRTPISEINLKNEYLLALNDIAEEASRAKSTFPANMSHEIPPHHWHVPHRPQYR